MLYNYKVKRYNNKSYSLAYFNSPILYGFKTNKTSYSSTYDIYTDIDNKQRSRRRTIQNIYDIAKSNEWEYFITLTFNKNKVDRNNYDMIIKKLTRQLKYIKSKDNNFKYLLVPDTHKKDKAYHFHGLISGTSNLKLIDSKKKTIKGQTIYNIKDFTFGFTTAISLQLDNEKIYSYITKYITKEIVIDLKYKKRYLCSLDLKRPIVSTYYINEKILTKHLKNFIIQKKKFITEIDNNGVLINKYSYYSVSLKT